MNSKQKIHANILIQVRRFRETKKRQEKNEEEEEEKKAFITREIFEEMKLKTKNKYISYHNLIA